MFWLKPLCIAALLGLSALTLPAPAMAEDRMIEDFTDAPETRWRFFSDTVMGGVSSGQVAFVSGADQPFARMTGRVSTANRGGFIQMRLALETPPAPQTRGIRLIARGNDQRYFVHLRSGGTILPWQYYQAGFDVTRDWQEFHLPFDSFTASGGMLRATPRAGGLSSVAIVAFGRDHEARIELRKIGFY